MPLSPHKIRALLTDRLAALDTEDAASAQDRTPQALDQQSVGRLSRMDAMQVQAMALAQGQRRQQERARIHATLARLDSDAFGWCAECGEPIADARLANDPTVTRCIACAR